MSKESIKKLESCSARQQCSSMQQVAAAGAIKERKETRESFGKRKYKKKPSLDISRTPPIHPICSRSNNAKGSKPHQVFPCFYNDLKNPAPTCTPSPRNHEPEPTPPRQRYATQILFEHDKGPSIRGPKGKKRKIVQRKAVETVQSESGRESSRKEKMDKSPIDAGFVSSSKSRESGQFCRLIIRAFVNHPSPVGPCSPEPADLKIANSVAHPRKKDLQSKVSPVFHAR